jgi:hypothetical protein
MMNNTSAIFFQFSVIGFTIFSGLKIASLAAFEVTKDIIPVL